MPEDDFPEVYAAVAQIPEMIDHYLLVGRYPHRKGGWFCSGTLYLTKEGAMQDQVNYGYTDPRLAVIGLPRLPPLEDDDD
jgi:hypothetical protein